MATKLGNQQQDSRHVVPPSTKTEKQIAWAKRPWPQRHETHLALLGVEKSRRSGDERTGEKWTASANRFRRIHVLGTLSLRSGKKKVAAPAATRARKSQDTDAHACALDENPPLSYLARVAIPCGFDADGRSNFELSGPAVSTNSACLALFLDARIRLAPFLRPMAADTFVKGRGFSAGMGVDQETAHAVREFMARLSNSEMMARRLGHVAVIAFTKSQKADRAARDWVRGGPVKDSEVPEQHEEGVVAVAEELRWRMKSAVEHGSGRLDKRQERGRRDGVGWRKHVVRVVVVVDSSRDKRSSDRPVPVLECQSPTTRSPSASLFCGPYTSLLHPTSLILHHVAPLLIANTCSTRRTPRRQAAPLAPTILCDRAPQGTIFSFFILTSVSIR